MIPTPKLVVDQGELQGIVDLDFFCYGDPMYMVALTETTVVLDIGFEALFYTEEIRRLWKLTAEQDRARALYGAIHGSAFLHRARSDSDRSLAPRMDQWVARCLSATSPGPED